MLGLQGMTISGKSMLPTGITLSKTIMNSANFFPSFNICKPGMPHTLQEGPTPGSSSCLIYWSHCFPLVLA